MPVRLRIPRVFLASVIAVSAACMRADGSSTQAGATLPAPTPPVWLTNDDLQRRTATLTDDEAEAYVQNLDVFVAMAIAEPGPTRDDRVAGTVLLIKSYLHRLFYPVSFETTSHPAEDPDFYRALAQFEQRAQLTLDGTFTVAEAARLKTLAARATETEIGVVPWKLVAGDATHASAEGTWVLQGERIAAPVNKGRVLCWRADGICTVFTADVFVPGDDPDDRRDGMLLTTDVAYYDIVRWTANEVRAESRTACRHNTLTLNWLTDQVHTISTDIVQEGCLGGPLPRPRVASLEDGASVAAFFQQRRQLLHGISETPFDRIDALMGRTAMVP